MNVRAGYLKKHCICLENGLKQNVVIIEQNVNIGIGMNGLDN